MSEKITIFDIEELNNDPVSICSIGIVVLEDMKVKETFYSLIRPPKLTFDPYRYKVHKIRPQDLKKQPTFPEIWPKISQYFENSIVISHDIQSDLNHLLAVFRRFRIRKPTCFLSCTLVLAKLFHPELQKYGLGSLCDYYSVELENAHNALADSLACAELLKKMMDEHHYTSIKELHEKENVPLGRMTSSFIEPLVSSDKVQEVRMEIQKETVAFTGKLAHTKQEIEAFVEQDGMTPSFHVTTQTRYLVIGKKDYKQTRYQKGNKKIKKAMTLSRQGQDIRILHEDQYIDMVRKRTLKA